MQRLVKLLLNSLLPVFFIVQMGFPLFVSAQTEDIPQQLKDMVPAGVNQQQIPRVDYEAIFKDKNAVKKTSPGEDLSKNLNNNPEKKDLLNMRQDSPQVISNRRDKRDISKETYGANIFQASAKFDIGELSTPPLDYPIGVGDHIIVSLWGGGEFENNYEVAKDGSIFPASLGKITIQGLTFENARSLIYSRFKSVVPSSTNVQITMGQPRTINVNVAGEVNNPGPVTISAFSNAFNIIGLAGGMTEFGNLREILIKRNGKVIETLDVYKYLTSGDIGKHIYLQNNDFILVGFAEKKVLATGQFKRPMYYQLKKTEGIKALVNYSGGFTSDALSSLVQVSRSEKEKTVIHNVNAGAIINGNAPDYILEDGDVVKLKLIKPLVSNKVEVKGEVNYPGSYEISANDRLSDLIRKAGGITKYTYLKKAYVIRDGADPVNIKTDRIEVNLEGIENGQLSIANDIKLMANDEIQLFSVNEFDEQQFVEIFGEVRKEGKVKKYGHLTLQDLIYMSGGLKQSAEYGRLEISSIVDIDSARQGLKPTRTLVRTFNIQSDLELDSVSKNIQLKPYDQVFVRKNPNFQLQQNVEIRGLIKYPGSYPKLSKNERLSAFIERAGGLLENANVEGAILYRRKTSLFRENIIHNKIADTVTNIMRQEYDSVGNITYKSFAVNSDDPISIDLANALKYHNSKHDIVLQENDLIYIPEVNPFVTVEGRVQSPLRMTYDKDHTNLLYYIDKAGGFSVKPWKKRIYVRYANGKSRRTRNLFFIHFYPKVHSGSTIFVPQRIENKDLGNTLTQGLITSLPIILTTIILRNIK